MHVRFSEPTNSILKTACKKFLINIKALILRLRCTLNSTHAQLSRFGQSAPTVASFCNLRCFSAHDGCKEWSFELTLAFQPVQTSLAFLLWLLSSHSTPFAKEKSYEQTFQEISTFPNYSLAPATLPRVR